MESLALRRFRSALQDLDQLPGHQRAGVQTLYGRQKRVDLCVAIGDFYNNRQVVGEAPPSFVDYGPISLSRWCRE